MIFTQKKQLAMAVAGVVSLGASVVHAVDFNATTTLQNTLAVTVIQDFDIGAVFATTTGYLDGAGDGVGAFVISPVDGSTSTPTAVSATVSLTSISAPTPAQGSVDTIGGFTLQLPDTSAIDETHFTDNNSAAGSLDQYDVDGSGVVELVHESGNTAVPSLYMMHFRLAGVSDGTITDPTDLDTGTFEIEPGFGVSTYIFNIGATITTEPVDGSGTDEEDALAYQEGIYSGTFEVTASY